ncbi:unnamed protein product [Bursaphelenchus okinawaensis]|uniref:Carboxypeptidase Q n=1 Tax=Bursaphelenchus okinawaensis TaxID=465554 RepID=A0A811KD71_9BILA|nr:unnamed protein product [Bursaphelenchus okinawaensis]CAG9097747.1 unnamed protein product [Bursaphelenchus okinawaensis]
MNWLTNFVFLITLCIIHADHPSKNEVQTLTRFILRGPSRNTGLEWLEPLVDDFGHRMLCRKSLDDAIDFTLARIQGDGFDNVHTEEAQNMPNWERGDDVVTLIEPRRLKLNILTIAGVEPANVTAEAVVLEDYDQVNTTDIQNKIVIFNQNWTGYFDDIKYRRAAKDLKARGAVGLLAKSVGPFSIGSPHTGSGTDDHLPSASLSLEEAEMLGRLARRNKTLVINMNIKSRNLPNCTSRNLIFDITGSEKPDEIVLISGHIDSWDLGQGALDDGGGLAAVWQAMKVIRELGQTDVRFRPKRTIRAVFWTAEEQGFFGAKHYYEQHKDGNEKFYFVSETDQGAFKPTTTKSVFRFKGNSTHRAKLHEIVHILKINGIPLSIQDGDMQGDVQSWANEGVPSINYVSDKGIDYYFYFHHTTGDYLNVFEDGDIDYTAAIMATLAHVIAGQESW